MGIWQLNLETDLPNLIGSADAKSPTGKEYNVGASFTDVFFVDDNTDNFEYQPNLTDKLNYRMQVMNKIIEKLTKKYGLQAPQINEITQDLARKTSFKQLQLRILLSKTHPYQVVAQYRNNILAEAGVAQQGSQALSESQLETLRQAELNFKTGIIGTTEFGLLVASDLVIDFGSTLTVPFTAPVSISLGATSGYNISQLAEQLRITSERQAGIIVSEQDADLQIRQARTLGATTSAVPFAIGYGAKSLMGVIQGNKIVFREATEQVGKNVGKKFSESVFEKLTEPQKFEYIKNLATQNGFEMSSHSVKRLLEREVSFDQVLDIMQNGQLFKDLKNSQNYILYKDGKYVTLYKDGTGGISTIVNANKTFPADRFAPVSRNSYYK